MAEGSEARALDAGLYGVPAGHLPTVVTYLEATEPPTRPVPQTGGTVEPWAPGPAAYLALWTEVGAPWLWWSRLAWSEERLAALLADPAYETFRLMRGGAAVGLLDLDFRAKGVCDIAYFGLVPSATGGGLGRALMDFALRRALARAPRCTVNTCTHDSPAALPFYLRSGFRPLRQEVEIVRDPRGPHLPPQAAPQIPRL